MGEKPITASEMGRRGGATRAKRYSKAQIRAWGKLGGRPRKLDPSDILRMRKTLRQGESKAHVAKKLGISVRTIGRAVRRWGKIREATIRPNKGL